MSLEDIPNNPLLLILRFIGRPSEFLCILSVCHSWRSRMDEKDVELWHALSVDYGIAIHSLEVKRTLRCTTNYRKAFFKAFYKKQREMYDKHELLVVHAKTLLQGNRDHPKKLERMIFSSFDDMRFFDSNYRGKTMEDNTLLTLSCRYSHFNCMKLLIDRYNADINIPDMGGFTPLILCAYHGNFDGVLYLLSRKADLHAVGRLRSGPRLTAEHWAAIQGNMQIFRYLHALRRRFIRENTDTTLITNSVKNESIAGTVPVLPPTCSVSESESRALPTLPVVDVATVVDPATTDRIVPTAYVATTTTTTTITDLVSVQSESLSKRLDKSESWRHPSNAPVELLSVPTGLQQCPRSKAKLPSFAVFLNIITATDKDNHSTNSFFQTDIGGSNISSKMLMYNNGVQNTNDITIRTAAASRVSDENLHYSVCSSSNSDSTSIDQCSSSSNFNQHNTTSSRSSNHTDANIMHGLRSIDSSSNFTLTCTDSKALSDNPDGVLAGSTAVSSNNNPDGVLAHPTANNASNHPDGDLAGSTEIGVITGEAIQDEDNRPPQRFCLCKRGFEGQMIACDGPQCRFEWFHYSCMGLHARPIGKWFCPSCMTLNVESASSSAATGIMQETATGIDSSSGKEAKVRPGTEEFCICGRSYQGAMVACDHTAGCLVEWFHFECVQLSAEPEGHWECPACTGGRFVQPVVTADRLEIPSATRSGKQQHSSRRRPRASVEPIPVEDCNNKKTSRRRSKL